MTTTTSNKSNSRCLAIKCSLYLRARRQPKPCSIKKMSSPALAMVEATNRLQGALPAVTSWIRATFWEAGSTTGCGALAVTAAVLTGLAGAGLVVAGAGVGVVVGAGVVAAGAGVLTTALGAGADG